MVLGELQKKWGESLFFSRRSSSHDGFLIHADNAEFRTQISRMDSRSPDHYLNSRRLRRWFHAVPMAIEITEFRRQSR